MAISGRKLELYKLGGADRNSFHEGDDGPSARDEHNRQSGKHELLDGDGR